MLNQIKEASNKKLYDQPKRSYLWMVYLPDLTQPPNDLSSPAEQASDPKENYEIPGNAPEKLIHRISSVSLPFINFETETMPFENKRKSYATAHQMGQISLDVEDSDDNLALRYFSAWQNLIKNNDGTYNPPYFYKRSIEYRHLSPSLEKLISIKYSGFFPTQITDLSLSYDSNDLVYVSVTLEGDNIELKDYNEINVDLESAYGLGLENKDIKEYVFKTDDIGNIMKQNLAQQIMSVGLNIPNLPF